MSTGAGEQLATVNVLKILRELEDKTQSVSEHSRLMGCHVATALNQFSKEHDKSKQGLILGGDFLSSVQMLEALATGTERLSTQCKGLASDILRAKSQAADGQSGPEGKLREQTTNKNLHNSQLANLQNCINELKKEQTDAEQKRTRCTTSSYHVDLETISAEILPNVSSCGARAENKVPAGTCCPGAEHSLIQNLAGHPKAASKSKSGGSQVVSVVTTAVSSHRRHVHLLYEGETDDDDIEMDEDDDDDDDEDDGDDDAEVRGGASSKPSEGAEALKKEEVVMRPIYRGVDKNNVPIVVYGRVKTGGDVVSASRQSQQSEGDKAQPGQQQEQLAKQKQGSEETGDSAPTWDEVVPVAGSGDHNNERPAKMARYGS